MFTMSEHCAIFVGGRARVKSRPRALRNPPASGPAIHLSALTSPDGRPLQRKAAPRFGLGPTGADEEPPRARSDKLHAAIGHVCHRHAAAVIANSAQLACGFVPPDLHSIRRNTGPVQHLPLNPLQSARIQASLDDTAN
jgi:hypothetical protein